MSIDTIENDLETYLSSLHFRNEVFTYKNKFWKKFKTVAESSWDGLTLKDIYRDNEKMNMLVKEGQFPGEIGMMGNGLQMWLQMIWFICKNNDSDVIVLDEPDVYMHPDLQLKLLEIINKMNKQVIISTHSVEIISTVEPDNILMIENKMGIKIIRYANKSDAVQHMIDSLGGIQNLSIIRLGMSRCCLFVEGQDGKVLSKIYRALFPDNDNIFSQIPIVELGGFSNVDEAFGTSNLFFNESNGNIKCFCILDSDYYSPEELSDIQQKAERHHLILHIWRKKEIENYLLIPKVMYSFFDSDKLSFNDFTDTLDTIAEEMKDGVADQISEKYHREHKKLDVSTCNEYARKVMTERWNTLDDKLSMVSGKEYLKKFRKWASTTYGVNISTTKIISKINCYNIDKEVIDVFEKF